MSTPPPAEPLVNSMVRTPEPPRPGLGEPGTPPLTAGEPEMHDPHDPEQGSSPPRLESVLMIVVMVALTLITLLNVLVRYLTNASFAFTEEVSASLMLILVLVGSSAALVRDRHIRVSYLVRNVQPATLATLERLSAAAFLVAFGSLAWYGIQDAIEDYRQQATSPALGLPAWLFSLWLPLVSLLICLRAIQVFARGGYVRRVSE